MGFGLVNCFPEALRVGGLVSSIYGAMGSSALVLLVGCLGQSLAALSLFSFSQFEAACSDFASFAHSVVLHVVTVRDRLAPSAVFPKVALYIVRLHLTLGHLLAFPRCSSKNKFCLLLAPTVTLYYELNQDQA